MFPRDPCCTPKGPGPIEKSMVREFNGCPSVKQGCIWVWSMIALPFGTGMLCVSYVWFSMIVQNASQDVRSTSGDVGLGFLAVGFAGLGVLSLVACVKAANGMYQHCRRVNSRSQDQKLIKLSPIAMLNNVVSSNDDSSHRPVLTYGSTVDV